MVGLQNSCIELFKIANPISDSRIERRFDLNDYPLNINPFHAMSHLYTFGFLTHSGGIKMGRWRKKGEPNSGQCSLFITPGNIRNKRFPGVFKGV